MVLGEFHVVENIGINTPALPTPHSMLPGLKHIQDFVFKILDDLPEFRWPICIKGQIFETLLDFLQGVLLELVAIQATFSTNCMPVAERSKMAKR